MVSFPMQMKSNFLLNINMFSRTPRESSLWAANGGGTTTNVGVWPKGREADILSDSECGRARKFSRYALVQKLFKSILRTSDQVTADAT
jgi:hypothetical protein